ncbi:MAG: hypothetical protein NWE95_00485 [Candidatus Bathyarchaeota archaeon]|nr:hypothetical protein [Candidatus Bathyarchaeota archaeon]
MKGKFLLIGCVVLLLAVLFAAVSWRPDPFMANPPPQAPNELREESLSFMRDVIGINLTDYAVVDFHFWPQWDVASSNHLPLYLVRYELEASDDAGWVDIYYTKANDTYTHEPYFSVYLKKPFSPPYPSDKLLTWTRDFLERYQNYKNSASYVSEMRQTLNLINHIEPMNLTNGNISLQIKIRQFTQQDIYTTLKLTPANTTTQDTNNAVTFEYHNGAMLRFDDWYGKNR